VGLGSVAEPLARLAEGIAPFVILAATVMVASSLATWRGSGSNQRSSAAWMGVAGDLSCSSISISRGTACGLIPSRGSSRVWHGAACCFPRWRSLYGPSLEHPQRRRPMSRLGLLCEPAVIGLVLLRVTIMDLVLRMAPKTSSSVSSAIMVEGGPPIPAILVPLRWLDAGAPWELERRMRRPLQLEGRFGNGGRSRSSRSGSRRLRWRPR